MGGIIVSSLFSEASENMFFYSSQFSHLHQKKADRSFREKHKLTHMLGFSNLAQKYVTKESPVRGILHLGAHECQELDDYLKAFPDLTISDIYWLDAIPSIVERMKLRNEKLQIFQAVLDNKKQDMIFNVSNNEVSSSYLPLGTHKKHHPNIYYVKGLKLQTTRLDDWITDNKMSRKSESWNFLNMDLQGAELRALQGMGTYLDHVDYIYCEVNREKVYEGCALLEELDLWLKGKGFKRVELFLWPSNYGEAFYVREKSDKEASV